MTKFYNEAIEISGVSKRYGRVLALDDISLNVPRNTLFALLGPNGAGKTTLMHILSTLLQPDSG
ncbi:MAG: ATP-binding cassette domain-containing protein, partial [Paracoccaceae bacterium]|nr:ATP-binding cassette domain-containing protein [Paracoccaceae bacterium]